MCWTSSQAGRSKASGGWEGGGSGAPAGYSQAFYLPPISGPFSSQIKARGPKKKKISEEPCTPRTALPCTPPPLFFLRLFSGVWGSCRNSADHQQLSFQRHLTLPNPRPSPHPGVANAHPSPPKLPLTVSHRRGQSRPSSASSVTCSHCYTL